MNNTDGALSFEASISNKLLQRDIADIKNRISGLVRDVETEAKGIDDTFRNLGRAAAGYFAFSELSQLPKQLINIRGEFQQLSTALTTMLGSKARADELFKSIVKFAATTPFDLKGVADASKQLIAYGFASDEIIDKIRRLGDISSGLNIPLGELAELYGKTRTNGRLFAEDLNQYVGRGIPLIRLLADQFHVAESEVRGLVETGKIGFPEVDKAINKLTDAGGTFAGLMEKNAKSLTGLYSNFEDSITNAFNKIGESQEGLLADSIRFGTTVVENYEPIVDVLTVLVATVGAYKAALIITAAVQSAAAGASAVKAWLSLATSIRSAADAQALFNLTTKANPFAVATSALFALIAAVALYSDEATEATKSQERALAIQERFNQTRADETTKVQILTKQIQDESRSRQERNEKLKELIAISPDHFNALTLDNLATDKGAEAVRNYTKALEKKLKVQASEEQIVQNNKRIRDIESGVLDDEFTPGILTRAKLFLEDSGFDEKKFKAATEKRKRASVQALKEDNKALLEVAAEGEAQRVKPAAKVVPKKEVEKAAKEEKEVRIKTFQEEIEEKKQMYELYQRWIDSFGKKAADEQFADLIVRNKDYVAFLNSKLEEIETAKNYLGFGLDAQKNVDFLNTEKAAAQGGPSAIEKFRTDLADAKVEAASLTDYIEHLKEVQAGLNDSDPTTFVKDQRQAIAEAILLAQKERKQALQEFLSSVAGSEQRQTAIHKQAEDDRNALDQLYADKKSKVYIDALDKINKKEKEDLEKDKADADAGNTELDALQKILDKRYETLTNAEYKEARDTLRELMKGLDKKSEEYQKYLKKLEALEREHNQRRLATIALVADGAAQLGDIFSSFDGKLGSAGAALSKTAREVASAVSALQTLTKKNEDGSSGFDITKITSIVSLITQAIGLIVAGAKRLKEAEKAYFGNAREFWKQYAIENNNKLGETDSNPFYTDYDAMAKAGIRQYSDAMKQYDEAISKLSTGRAVTGFNGGFFRKDKNIYGDLLKTYPELVDSAGNLNVEMAKLLISTNRVDDATKQVLQSAIDWSEQVEKSQQQIEDNVATLIGMIGNQLTDSMISAFQSGEDAAVSFGETVGDVIGNVVKQTILLNFIKPSLDKLTEEINQSYSEKGDKNIIDDLERYKEYGLPGYQAGIKYLEDFNEWAKKNGFGDVFGKDKGSSNSGSAPAQQGVITGASQESINLLQGQITAQRIIQADHLNVARNSLFQLTAIRVNTQTISENTEELYAIRRTMDNIERVLGSDWFRAIGGN